MHAVLVVIDPELFQLALQIDRIPKEQSVKIFSANGTDHPFDKRMRNRDVRNRLDLIDLEYPQVGQPAVEAEQRDRPAVKSEYENPSSDACAWRIAIHATIGVWKRPWQCCCHL